MINSILTHVLLALLTGEGGNIVTSHHMWYAMSCEDSVQLWDDAANRCRMNYHNVDTRACLGRAWSSAKLKSTNIFVYAGFRQFAKFNSRQIFWLYGNSISGV